MTIPIEFHYAVLAAAVIAPVWWLAVSRTGRKFVAWIFPGWRNVFVMLAIWAMVNLFLWSLFFVAVDQGHRAFEAEQARRARP